MEDSERIEDDPFLRTVTVVAPADLVIRADNYLADLLREAGLLRANTVGGPSRGLLLAINALLERHEHVRVALREQADAAVAAGRHEVELRLRLALDATFAIRRFLSVYLRLIGLAEQEQLLTLPPSPDVAAFQERWAREVIAQLEEGSVLHRERWRTRRQRERHSASRARPQRTSPAPGLRVRLRPTPAAALQARRLLQSICDEALCEAAALPLSEVVTNAVVHARTDLELTLHLHGHRLRAEVRDGAGDLIPVRTSDPEASFGRGLALVEALVDRWGVLSDAGGKTVWFEVGQPASGSALVSASPRIRV